MNPEPTPTDEAKPEQEASSEVTTEEVSESAETPQSDTETPEPTYTVKANGKEIEVTLEDLKKGFMMESDYRHKTSEVANKRKALDSEFEEFSKTLSDAKLMLNMDMAELEANDELKEFPPGS